MKVIDLLNKIANGEEVPKKVRVLDQTLLPEYQIITWNEDLNLYEYCDGCEFDRVLDKHHLEKYIKIIESTPKEDNIQKWGDLAIEDIKKCNKVSDLKKYIEIMVQVQNEIIDKVNGE